MQLGKRKKVKNTVYIHTNAKQFVGAKVSEYSIKKASKHSDKFEVKIIKLENFSHLLQREGQTYLRKGRTAVWRNGDLQSFTPLRFLPPQLQEYQGRSLVIDPDVFALADVYDLMARDMNDKGILCRKIESKQSDSYHYASSVMLLDCSKLTHWKWERQIDEMFDLKLDYRTWISLLTETENLIGPLEDEWNHFDTLSDKTKLLHNTSRITQPWKTGLPIDFTPKRQSLKSKVLGQIKVLLRRRRRQHSRYQRHPDPSQERFFFSLLKECVDQGHLTEDFLRTEIQKEHLRPDALELLASL